MKSKTKKILSLILVLVLICTAVTYAGLHAFAATSGVITDSNDEVILRWNLHDDGLFTVSGNGYGPDYNSSLATPWYRIKSDIKEVIVEEGVQAIGNYWFSGCSNLTKVTLPDSMYKMGARVFQSCSKLENITMPAGCTEYYNYNFSGCTALKWAVLPSDCTNNSHSIPDYTFNGCSALENVWVGGSHTGISSNTFKSCSALTSIVWCGNTISSVSSTGFPSGVSFVGKSSIQSWCSNNSKSFINIAGASSSTVSYSFDLNNKKLTLSGTGNMSSAPWDKWRYFIYGVDLGNPSGICADAFKGCEYLEGEMKIPASVTQIGNNAFSGAGYDYYVFDGDSVSIADSAFAGKEKLTFLGNNGSNIYSYVSAKENDNPNWKYYCLDRHDFDGVGAKCDDCDKVQGASIIEALDGHSYAYQSRVGDTLYYNDSRSDSDVYGVKLRELQLSFDSALSTSETAYSGGYDGRFDINRDGFVNGKDYTIIAKMLLDEKTDYDMTLSNENATEQTKRLYAFIAKNYTTKVITGQQESTWMNNDSEYEMKHIYNCTGKYPAIRGLDFMGDDFNGVVNRARAWHNRGGIVTICWHCSKAFDQSYDACKADEFTAEEWEKVLTKGTPENTAFLAAMDKAGNALMQLQNEGIPVLWRPFHEFDGGWFWWGKGGSEYFKRLWIMMYEHYTNDLGLNNLIWVLGYSHNGMDYGANLADWYPGDRYCDIVGADSYEVKQNGAEKRLYTPVYDIVKGRKPLAMHESGRNPTIEDFEEVPWVYFMTWHTSYLTDENSAAALNALYNNDYSITLDEINY